MDNHFEVMWDTFRNVPSIETPGASVLDEYYWLNKHDPNYSLCRATVSRGQDAHMDKKFTLDKESALALSQLFITPEKDLENKKISEVLPESFWDTNFWLHWKTMFAFQRWSSAVIYILIETAKENALDPYRYLLWVLRSAPTLSRTDAESAEKLVPTMAPQECSIPQK